MYPKSIVEYTPDELKQAITTLGMPSYRLKQVFEWLYKKSVYSFDKMTNLSKQDKDKLSSFFSAILPQIIQVLKDKDLTTKILISFYDSQQIEAVAIPDDDKTATYCLSTQAGCSMGCVFCHTARLGYKRNLTAEEITAQVMLLNKVTGFTPDNIVFMGMGEPFRNKKALFKAIDTLTDKNGFGMATRRITVSTVGIPSGICDLADRPGEVNLAVSLHAASDFTRTKLLPVNKKYSLSALKEAILYYVAQTNRRVTFEVVLLKGVNDQEQDAFNLINFCEGLPCHINLIRYNPYVGSIWRPSPEKDEKEFRKILKKAGLPVTIRQSRGASIGAACGQLAGINNG